MAQHIETKDERPLQHFWLKNFLAVDTTDSRLAPLDNACFYDLTNCQPVGFSNLHSVNDISAVLHDFSPEEPIYSWNINIQGVEHLLIATRATSYHPPNPNPITVLHLWDYNVATGVTTAISPPSTGQNFFDDDGSLDIVQWDYTKALIVANNGYWYWVPGSPATPVLDWPGDAQVPPVPPPTPTDPNPNAIPSGGNAIAVYNNMTWIASKRLLYFSASTDFTQFSTTQGGGFAGLTDPTLKSDVKALFVANGYLYVFGETSIDAISDVYYPIDPATGQQLATPSFTKLNISAIIGTDQADSIMVFGRAVLFANRMGVWSLYGTQVQQISAFDPNNMYMSSISGTWQYLAISERSISGGQVLTNALLNAAWRVVRSGDPIFPDGPFVVMWQQDAAGGKWWSLDYSEYGSLTHVVMALVNYAPALFGCIDNKLYQLIADPTSAPRARVMTSLWDLQDPITDKQVIRSGVRLTVTGDPAKIGVNINMDTVRDTFPLSLTQIGLLNVVNNTSQLVALQNSSGAAISLMNVDPPFFAYWGAAPGCFSKYIGYTLTTRRGSIFEINSFLLDYKLGPRWTGD